MLDINNLETHIHDFIRMTYPNYRQANIGIDDTGYKIPRSLLSTLLKKPNKFLKLEAGIYKEFAFLNCTQNYITGQRYDCVNVYLSCYAFEREKIVLVKRRIE